MEQAATRPSFGGGLLAGFALPAIVSIVSDGLEFFEPRGLGTALLVALVAVGCLVFSNARLFALGALLGAGAYYPFALVWAAGHGMSLGG
ncbi:hypothetical protein [Nocardioides jejuensis]|uniref:Uncharacterized protein n=1 Tax=Nocardioides jejuensis TaxID=2502782 RepID=A0A4R1CCF2_9ACTN|nr:hypothetical protein [Nocardioides jejuensis]TCJ28629.1 hypothetical protein EPD65_07950 [Nocardioides jejuensis]